MARIEALFAGLFYVLIIVAGLCLLAAVQLRSPGGASYDTWRLNYDSNRLLLEAHESQLQPLQEKLAKNRDWLNFTTECLKFYNENGEPNADAVARTAGEVKAAKEAHKPIEQVDWSDARCILRGYAMLKWDSNYYIAEDMSLQNKIQELGALIKTDRGQFNELVKINPDFLAFKEMEKIWYTKLFVIAPYDFLVQILVVIMGSLGGMVRILREYGNPNIEDPAARDYFVVPLIGAVVSIGGYILAKTGLLLLSSAKGEASLSPFMVGLVGIVSGLLAKEVIDRIATVGRNILGNRGEATGGQAAPAREPPLNPEHGQG
jgi:hypothetical protein